MQRWRVSLDQSIVPRRVLTQFAWSVYAQKSDTGQIVDEARPAAGPTPAVNRSGTLDYSQDTVRRNRPGAEGLYTERPERPGDLRRQLQTSHVRHAAGSRGHQRAHRRRRPADEPDPPDQVLPEERGGRDRRLRAGGVAPGPRAARSRRPLRPFFARSRRHGHGLPRDHEPGAGGLFGRCGLIEARCVGPGVGGHHAARAVRGRVPGAALQRRQQRLHEPAGRLHVDSEHRPEAGDETTTSRAESGRRSGA